jgi:hypothetical protein
MQLQYVEIRLPRINLVGQRIGVTLVVLVLSLAFARAQERVSIVGTKCSMIPPKEFVFSSSFSGFLNEEMGASIMVSELPIPYQALVNGFTAAELKKRGMILKSKKTIDFQKSKATFYMLTQQVNDRIFVKQMLLFGVGSQSIMVNGIYPEVYKSIEPQVKEALLSTRYNPKQKNNPLASAPYVLDVAGTELKFTNYLSGSYLYTIDGKTPTSNPIFIVSKSIDYVEPTNHMKYAEERLMALPGCATGIIKTMKPIVMDSLRGFETEAECKGENGHTNLIYQVILFQEQSGYFLMVGKAKKETLNYPETFKKLALRIKRK